MVTARAGLAARVLRGIGDPALPAAQWRALLDRGDTREVFLTREWLDAWWRCHPRGRILPVLVLRDGVPVLMAPFFAEAGMVFFCGAGSADYLDLLGDVTDTGAVGTALAAARAATAGFVGFRLHHVPDGSRTADALRGAATVLGLDLVDEGTMDAPYVDLAADAVSPRPAAHRRSLVRHERGLARCGELSVVHDRAPTADDLEPFFAQHVRRWAGTPYPSAFTAPGCRAFFRAVAAAGAAHGWVVFTTVRWNGTAVAFHLGFDFAGSLLWYKPSFDPAYAARSPGEVLLRRLLLLAREIPGCTRFDFGIGDEAFKYRFATGVRTVRTWGLYPLGPRTG
ncbi:glycosyl transferase [Couchioplanes caeruleus subsp. azureus]|nr:glycosyl transferase [Couchioplanes caeruleus subsp. azureus]